MKNFKNIRLVVIVLAVLAVLVFVILQKESAPTSVGKCGPYRNDKTVVISKQALKAEVVTTKKEQSTGLSNRPCIEQDQVMMFVFEKPGQWAIWMKDMKFPIDVLWADANGNIVGVERNVQPSTYPDSFTNKEKNAVYVIEMKANRSSELGIGLGTKVQIK